MKFKKLFVAVCLFALCLGFTVFATNTASGGVNFFSPPNQVSDVVLNQKVFGITVITGNNIDVSADIDGTSIVFGNGIDIKGNINGDLISFGNYITMEGSVDGNSYLFGNSISLIGKVSRDFFGFGSNISIKDSAQVLRDVIMFSANNTVTGNVGRNISSYAGTTSLNGSIGGNAYIEGSMNLNSSATINGNLNQVNDKEDSLNGAKVSGDVKYTYRNPNVNEITMAQRISSTIRSFIFFLILGTVIWLIVIFLKPSFIKKGMDLLEKPLQTIGLGAIILIVAPIAIIITLITIVGIPIGIISAMIYGILIYLSRFLFSIIIANFLVKKLNLKSFHNNFWYVLLTFLIVSILSKIPYLSTILAIAYVCAVFGMVFYKNHKDSYIG
ncbi:MAG: hypothetical protein FWC47_13340 [Oscillospiraceae bacterium]|nr:hypothetical protein [Oscillospiraceae bacterium]